MSDYYPNSKLAVKLDPIVEPKRREIQDRQPYKFPKGYINYQTFLELVLVSEIRKNVFKYPDDLDVTTAIFGSSGITMVHNGSKRCKAMV